MIRNPPASPLLNGSRITHLDLNLIEILWHELKQSIHAGKPSNVAELKQFCKEWVTIPPQRCERLIASYRKRLIAVVTVKGGTTSY